MKWFARITIFIFPCVMTAAEQKKAVEGQDSMAIMKFAQTFSDDRITNADRLHATNQSPFQLISHFPDDPELSRFTHSFFFKRSVDQKEQLDQAVSGILSRTGSPISQDLSQPSDSSVSPKKWPCGNDPLCNALVKVLMQGFKDDLQAQEKYHDEKLRQKEQQHKENIAASEQAARSANRLSVCSLVSSTIIGGGGLAVALVQTLQK